MTRRHAVPSSMSSPRSGAHHLDRLLESTRHDSYQALQKYGEPTVCPDCALVFHEGRWTRGEAASWLHAQKQRCPACRRIADDLPAGTIDIAGPFAAQHRADILALVRHEARREQLEHPLHRVIATQADEDHIVVTTTDVRLPRRIGRALKDAYDGRLLVQQARDEYFVRVHWTR